MIVGLAGSHLIKATRSFGMTAVEEAFADRAYNLDGTLVSRQEAGAVLSNEQEVGARALDIVQKGIVRGLDGQAIPIRGDTICIHGDTAGADRLARSVRDTLTKAGVSVIRMDHAET